MASDPPIPVAGDEQLVDDGDREVLPKEVHVLGLVAEPELSHDGVNPTAAEHQIECASRSLGERGFDPAVRFEKPRETFAEDDFDTVTS